MSVCARYRRGSRGGSWSNSACLYRRSVLPDPVNKGCQDTTLIELFEGHWVCPSSLEAGVHRTYHDPAVNRHDVPLWGPPHLPVEASDAPRMVGS